jgi:hypothetical protein
MADLVNEFTWSKSRHEKFTECRRAYYYQYYGSWGGWEAPPGTTARELYVLKKLSSRWQWAGSLVHDALKEMLTRAKATGRITPVEDLCRRTHDKARAQWANSREKSYWGVPSRIVGLVEHEYAEPVPGEEWKRIYHDVVDGSLRAFYQSEIFAQIQATPRDRWLTVDVLDSWEFEGTKVWVAIDFAYRDEQGILHILDWKTGKERGVDHTQIGIYALFAQQKWGVSAAELMGGLVYLQSGAARTEVQADPATLESCKSEMRESIAAMKAPLEDPKANRARLEMFPQLEDPAACKRCPFRRPCGRL